MNKTEKEVIKFFKEKGLFDKITPQEEFFKIVEEVGELGRTLLDKDLNSSKYELGDVLISCAVFAHQLGTDLSECIKLAHGKNINRKGKMIGVNYVKLEDIKE